MEYYENYKHCVIRNNVILSPTIKVPGLENIPVLKVSFCFVLLALLGYLTKYNRDMKYIKLDKQCLKGTKKAGQPMGRSMNGTYGPMQGA